MAPKFVLPLQPSTVTNLAYGLVTVDEAWAYFDAHVAAGQVQVPELLAPMIDYLREADHHPPTIQYRLGDQRFTYFEPRDNAHREGKPIRPVRPVLVFDAANVLPVSDR